jgi:hypothetical protein
MSGKKRTREHIIADLSSNFVERQVLLCGFTAERVYFDYGIDLTIRTYNQDGEVEDGFIFVQLKATENLKQLTPESVKKLAQYKSNITQQIRGTIIYDQ